MAKLIVYEYPKCGTCRTALKVLRASSAGHELELHNLFEVAPSEALLWQVVKASGLPVRKLFNTSGELYKELGLKDRVGAMSEQEMIQLLASNGRLVKRPLVLDANAGVASVGFNAEHYAEIWQ